MMKTTLILTGMVVAAAFIYIGSSDDSAAQRGQSADGTQRSQDEKAILNSAEAFVKAFDQADAKAVAATFAANGQMSMNGESIAEGRDAIEKVYAEFFKMNPGVKIVVTIDSLRLLGPNLAIDKGTSQVGTGDEAAADVDAYTVVHVQQNGKWLTVTADIVQRPAQGQIDWKKELAFLEGKWIAEAKGWRVETTVEWVAGGNFLKRSFEVTDNSKTETSGVQIIGWDPIEGAVTSWICGSDGGHGRGWWTHDGDNWVIESEGTTADGTVTQATNVITLLGEDNFRWQSTNRSIDGVALEDTDSIRVRRLKKN